MESYAVARKIATDFGFLSLLNASQEMFAVGMANILGSVASAFPVCGSFSRSALNANSGAVTPFSKTVTILVIVTACATLTQTFKWIPNAALAAVIMVALLNLVDLQSIWNAWKYSKKDFFVMITTLVITFMFDTGVGLAAGICLSVAILLRDMAFELQAAPVAKSIDFKGVTVVRLHSNLVFITGGRIKDSLQIELLERKNKDIADTKAIVLDFIDVHHVDLSGMQSMKEIIEDVRKQGIPVVLVNVMEQIEGIIWKIGIKSDVIDDPKLQSIVESALPLVGRASDEERGLSHTESLSTAVRLIRERSDVKEGKD
jgi:MFS superfamily sulfate permease-like transporter